MTRPTSSSTSWRRWAKSAPANPVAMLAIHPRARTTPAVRAEIARSPESSGVLAKRYGVSTEIIRKWRKRGPDACQDRSARLHKLPWRSRSSR